MDTFSLWVIHIILILICVFSIWENRRTTDTTKEAKPGAGISVSEQLIRGERSMNAIYVMYGIATIAITLAVQVAETAKGFKSGIVIMDYAIFDLSILF